jgi:large subunit ribosomal protein L25
MEEVIIKANRRAVLGKQVSAIRREGKLPAVIYGHHIDPISIELNLRDASKSLTGLAPSTLVTVEVDGETHKTLVREKQRNKITGMLLHVDFLAVSMKEKLRAGVYVEITGVSPAVKDLNGVLVSGADEVHVESLPQDLPERITIDISRLQKIGDGIYIRDLQIPDGVKVLDDPDTMIAVVMAQAAEEVVAAPVVKK